MSERYESIKRGLEDAIAYAQGDTKDCRPWVHDSPEDIRRIGGKLGFSPAEFAAKLHIPSEPCATGSRVCAVRLPRLSSS